MITVSNPTRGSLFYNRSPPLNWASPLKKGLAFPSLPRTLDATIRNISKMLWCQCQFLWFVSTSTDRDSCPWQRGLNGGGGDMFFLKSRSPAFYPLAKAFRPRECMPFKPLRALCCFKPIISQKKQLDPVVGIGSNFVLSVQLWSFPCKQTLVMHPVQSHSVLIWFTAISSDPWKFKIKQHFFI